MESVLRNVQAVEVAKAAMDATPTPVALARELGEENFHGDEHGKFEVRAVDKHGAPDLKKARLLREMFQPKWQMEEKLSALTPQMPDPERRVARGAISVTGGWLDFDEHGRVIR